METNPDVINAADVPHALQMVNQQVAGRDSWKVVGDMLGEKMGLDAQAEPRPASDPAPYGMTEPPDAEDGPTEETVDDKLDRIFGSDEPQQAPQPKPQPQPEAAVPQPVPAEAFSANIFSWEESQHIAQFEVQREQWLAAAAHHQQEAQLIERIADPQRKEAAKLWHAQREAALAKQAETLVRAGEGIFETAKTRQESQLMQRRSNELQKLRSALPDFDAEKSRAYLKSYGYDDALINQLNDHRVFVLAEKARKFDEMQRQSKPKVVKRVSRVADDRQKLKRANRTGNYEGAAEALDRRLGEIFR